MTDREKNELRGRYLIKLTRGGDQIDAESFLHVQELIFAAVINATQAERNACQRTAGQFRNCRGPDTDDEMARMIEAAIHRRNQ